MIICIATCFLQTNLFPDIYMYWLMVATSDAWVDWLSTDAAVVAFDRVPRPKWTLSLRRVWGSGHHQSMKSPGKSLEKFHQRHMFFIRNHVLKASSLQGIIFCFFVSGVESWSKHATVWEPGPVFPTFFVCFKCVLKEHCCLLLIRSFEAPTTVVRWFP